MAPTICSDKTKQQNLCANHKELRRQRPTRTRNIQQHHRTVVTTNNATTTSSIINYLSNGSLNPRTSGLRLSQRNEQNNESNNAAAQIERFDMCKINGNISDNYVSSSTTDDDESVENQDAISLSERTINTTDNRIITSNDMLNNSSNNSSLQYSDDDDYHYDRQTENMEDNDNEIHSITNACIERPTLRPLQNQTVLNLPKFSQNSFYANININNDNIASDIDTNFKNTDGLLSIAIKTIKLVQRNQLLQRRLAQLKMETSEFIESVMANPENRQFREKLQQTKQQSREKI